MIKLLASRIKSLREFKGWTQTDLENASGVAQAHISRLESAKSPSVSVVVLSQIADALDTSLDYLTGRTDSPAPRPPVNDPALKDPRFAYFASMWPLLPDYAHDIFIRQIKGMELYNDDLRAAMVAAGLDVPPKPPKE